MGDNENYLLAGDANDGFIDCTYGPNSTTTAYEVQSSALDSYRGQYNYAGDYLIAEAFPFLKRLDNFGKVELEKYLKREMRKKFVGRKITKETLDAVLSDFVKEFCAELAEVEKLYNC